MPKIVKKLPQKPSLPQKTLVAAYARVSSGKDAMLHSLSSQVSYYSKIIQEHEGWMYVGVYADEAMTGTKENRADFQRLLNDCRAGKVNMIITKSISRFARNTVTLLETVRELKSLGVDVFFEEQNIHTLSTEGELMLTILASYAQEESLSASENQKWRIKRNFEQGKPWSGVLLGYRYENGKFIIVPGEAETVRRIFADYLGGLGVLAISKRLNDEDVPTRNGGRWSKSGVERILRNYNYTGNLLLQKTFSENHISKRKMPNNGELPQYHAEQTHEPIIPIEQYEQVQAELHRRAVHYNCKHSPPKKYPFTGLLTCDHCGKHYRRKTTKGGIVWICSTYNSLGKSHCPSKQVPESTLESIAAEFDGIEQIIVADGNTLHFRLANSETVTRTWQDRSRADSWTEEMKLAARERSQRICQP